MKKKISALILSLFLVVGLFATSAMAISDASVRASKYLNGYGAGLDAMGDGQMRLSYEINGTGRMSKIGAQYIRIEKKVGTSWSVVDTYYAVDYPAFYAYDAYGNSGYEWFTGTPGTTYRVTVGAFAMNSSGSDTGSAASPTLVCK